MVHKLDLKPALEGEGWAIQDYTERISRATTEHEREVLTHIRDEEKQHAVELLELMKCKKV
jgi:hypothetical protein